MLLEDLPFIQYKKNYFVKKKKKIKEKSIKSRLQQRQQLPTADVN